MRVAGLGYSDGARNLEVMLESLSGGRRREIQEDGIVMEVKNASPCLLAIAVFLRAEWLCLKATGDHTGKFTCTFTFA